MRQSAPGSLLLFLILAVFPAVLAAAASDKGVTLRGRVTDVQGRPISGADVWLLPVAAEEARRPAAVTGPEGRFALHGLPPGKIVDLQICRDGYEPGGVLLKAPTTAPVRTVLIRAAYISGRVLDEARQPVNEAQVQARIPGVVLLESRAAAGPCAKADASARTVTGKDGSFRLGPLSPGPFSVTARREGFLDARSDFQDVQAGRGVEGLEIVIRRGAEIEGQALAPDGAPLEGIRVRLVRDGSPSRTAETEGDGRFRLTGIEPGDWLVEAFDPADPGAEPERRNLRVEPGKNWTELTLRKRERHAVHGQVIGPDGRGLEGAQVRAEWFGPRSLWGYEHPVSSTRSDGSFALELSDGHYRLSAFKEGYARAELPGDLLVDGESDGRGSREGVEIRMTRGGAVAGQVRGLKPEEHSRVMVSTYDGNRQLSVRLDAQGRYRLEGLTPGSLVVEARAGEKLLEGTVVLEPGQAEATLDLVFPPTSPASGRLVGAQGEPIARGRIEIHSVEGAPREVSVRSLSDGTFTADLEDGTYTVRAQARGYSATALPQPLRIAGAPVAGIDVVLPREAVIRGRVSGLEAGTRIESIYAEGPTGYRSGHGSPDGTYRISEAGPGEWKVTASHGGRRIIGRVTVQPGATEAVLDLDLPTGDRTITGQILGLEEPRAFHIQLFRPGQPDPLNGYISGEGRFRLRWLDEGLYELKVVRQGEVWYEQTVMLSSDQELTIDLTGARP